MDGHGGKLVPDSVMKDLFSEDDEAMFVAKGKKISTWGIGSDRVVILSEYFLMLLTQRDIDKKIPISQVCYYIKSMSSNEILLHFTDNIDWRLVFEKSQEFLDILTARFPSLEKKRTLRQYAVPEASLKAYKASKTQYAFDNAPEEKYRLRNKEIPGTDKEEEKTNKDNNQEPENFQFENRSSIVAGETNMRKPGGDDQINMEFDDEEDMEDNLAGHLGQINLEEPEDPLAEQFEHLKKQGVKRKLTVEEQTELRSTQLVRKKNKEDKSADVSFEDFNFLMVIGRGTFGKVFLAEHKASKKLYACKSIRKDILIQYDQVDNTILEKDIMFECDHPFLVGMEYLFQNDLRLYFVMPFVRGGEMYKIFQSQKRFKEESVIFYGAQMIIAVGYLHSKGIVHRDLKLENILCDADGYIKIIDYGLAKMLGDDQETTSFCGTPEYLAPEMISQTGHDKAVDWWAVGVLMYEMLIGVTPFFNKNKNMLMQKIQKQKVVFPDRKKYKIDFSDEMMDLIVRLLDKDKNTRMGSKDDFFEILSHPVFKGIDIQKLESKSIEPPFKP